MPKNPKHRPPNMRRIESMARHYVAAWENLIIRDEELRDELYSGNEFPPIEGRVPSDLDQIAIDEIYLVWEYRFIEWYEKQSGEQGLLVDWREGLSDNQDMVIDWHEQTLATYEPLSREPRGDKMLVYKIAAATFNNQLAIDQAGNESLGIEPSRLDEKPTTASALQRALSRPNGVEAIVKFKEFCKKNTSV